MLPLDKGLHSSQQPDPPQPPNTESVVWRWRIHLQFSHARHVLSGRRDSGWWTSKYQRQVLNSSYEPVMRAQLPPPTCWVKGALTLPSPFGLNDLGWHLPSSDTDEEKITHSMLRLPQQYECHFGGWCKSGLRLC